MKHLQTIFLLACLTALAMPAWSQCPDANGIWGTGFGNMTGGRATEAWCSLPSAGVPGNIQNAMSWDGATLGGQWRAWGMTIDANGATLIGEADLGNGLTTKTYQTFYEDGQFWLTGNNTWGDGINDLNGILDSYQVDVTISYLNGSPVGATSNIAFSGEFVNCPEYQGCRVEFVIANANLILGMPADYPPLLCGTQGEAFDVCCITMSINCAIPTESETWSGIKAMYR